MICVKRRSAGEDWSVYHSGMGDGSPAINYHMQWNNISARYDGSAYSDYVWGGVAPDATHFSVGGSSNPDRTNSGTSDYVAMLFASVDGISKCGTYTGSPSGVSLSVTTGFQPRFLLLKRLDAAGDWYVFDTTRGWASGDDKNLYLNSNNAQGTHNYGEPTSTGFTFNTVNTGANTDGAKYIYYAHA